MQPLSQPSAAQANAETDRTANQFAMRVGTVQSYDAGTVAVAISGSTVLVSASYLKGYTPIIGELVAVLRNGSQWLVLGSMTGSPSDNVVLNPSFNQDANGTAVPTNWVSFNTTGVASTTITNPPWAGMDIDGPQVLAVTAAGSNIVNVMSSAPITVTAGQVWAAKTYVSGQGTGGVIPQAGIFFSYYLNSVDVYPTTGSTDSTTMTIPAFTVPAWLTLGTGGVAVPPGVTSMRVSLRSTISAAAGTGTVYWDQVSARLIR
jgi:hypothetical protein